MREALREVSPGKPTDSSVEIITPRRQRPAREKDLGIEPADKAAPGAHGPTRSTAGALPAANAPGKEKPSMDFEKASEEVFTAPEAVETEIGPLPVDLWELIGESPQAAQPRPMQTASPATSVSLCRRIPRSAKWQKDARGTDRICSETTGGTRCSWRSACLARRGSRAAGRDRYG